ncbi:MAG: hypothetical protein AB2N28_4290 [Candidatus Phytoplasma solani]
MPIVIKKQCQNGNLYIHYSNGKIKLLKWNIGNTKKIKFYPRKKTL